MNNKTLKEIFASKIDKNEIYDSINMKIYDEKTSICKYLKKFLIPISIIGSCILFKCKHNANLLNEKETESI